MDIKVCLKRPTKHFEPHDSCYFVIRICNVYFFTSQDKTLSKGTFGESKK